MSVRYYDDALIEKIKAWFPDNRNLRILKDNDVTRLIESQAFDSDDSPLTLPIIMLSRGSDIQLDLNVKNVKSFDGLRLGSTSDNKVAELNVIPITVNYQLDIFTESSEDADEYVRQLLFKLVNNPTLYINIPYNNFNLKHIANLRVGSTISDTSDISQHLFIGQFSRRTFQLTLMDGFLFNIPYRKNWMIEFADLQLNKETPTEDIQLDFKKDVKE